nr:MAG TPA: hypothetical protein [Caudoviricetes sp.]
MERHHLKLSFHFFNLLYFIINILIILDSNIYRINTLRLSKSLIKIGSKQSNRTKS